MQRGMAADDGALEDERTWGRLAERIHRTTPRDVERALGRDEPTLEELAALLSPQAAPALEEMASRARELTLRRFGRIVVLYVPLYLSNECTNGCTYCGFSHHRTTPRRTLGPREIEAEVDRLKAERFDHVLLLTGEDRRAVPPEALEAAVRYAHGRFSSVGVEIYPMGEAEYERLGSAGCDALTLYQETYHQPTYRHAHPAGPKSDFFSRLETPARAARAGLRTVSIGALLGLADWRVEGLCLALHGWRLRHHHWRTRLSFGFPRLRDDPGGGIRLRPLAEAELAQLVCSLRLCFPDADLVLSTRERASFRDGMVGLGVTRMSAGSRTNPGGYAGASPAGEQFAVTDHRSAAELARMIEQRGFEPVWKDWDRAFGGLGSGE